MSPLSATVTVSWGNDVQVSLNLTPRNWAKLKAGKTLHLRGRGYYYEGELFRDYWFFGGAVSKGRSSSIMGKTVQLASRANSAMQILRSIPSPNARKVASLRNPLVFCHFV
jgi:hypothetical protein